MEKLQFTKTPDSNSFFLEAKHRVYAQLGKTSSELGPNSLFWLKALFWCSFCWGSYVLILSGNISGWLIVPFALIFKLSGLLFGFSIGHDAAHRLLSAKSAINRVLHFISFITVGVDPTLWGLRHIRSHHIYPNVEGSDIDIDKNPLLRLSPHHPWKPKHRWQHIYAPFAYAVALHHSVFWGDWIYLLSEEYKWMRKGVSKIDLWTSFIAFKITHFFMLLVFPYLVLGYPFALIFFFYLAVGAVSSSVFIVMLVGTHFFLEASYPSPNEEGKLETNWAVHNLLTSCDWNPNNGLARFISGGANCHAAHHLFPNICHIHYGEINGIIEDLTRKHSVTYHKKTLWEMLTSHYQHLKSMGQKPKAI